MLVVNMIITMGSAGQIDEAEALLAKLRTITDDHIQLHHVRGHDPDRRAEALLAQFRSLADNYPNDSPVIAVAGVAAVLVLKAQAQGVNVEGAKATARWVKGLLRHPAVIAEIPQRFGGDGAGQLDGMIEALLSDD